MADERKDFAIKWATVLLKLRRAEHEKTSVSFDADEVATMVQGLVYMLLPKESK